MNTQHFQKLSLLTVALLLMACGGKATGKQDGAKEQPSTEAAPSNDSIREHVVLDFGNRTIRTTPDESISMPALMKNRKNCFLVLSKKDYYLYVYEAQGNDTVMLARYDCAFALKKGDKTKTGDMRTPHCVSMSKPFHIEKIKNAHDWCHDFKDGRGSIRSYGDYFMQLRLDGHPLVSNHSIGIHGSTNNRESVPGRASEGCIRLKDEDIKDLRETYASVEMKVFIKSETMDDLPFETHAFAKQGIERKRHFAVANTLTNEQIATAPTEQGRVKKAATRKVSSDSIRSTANAKGSSKNKTLEQLKSKR